MRDLNSLRARLSAYLLLAAFLTAGAIGIFTYRETLEQNKRLFDDQLRQTALSLRDQGMVEDWPPDLFAEEANEVMVRIRTLDGDVMYVSHPGVTVPEQASIGFSTLTSDGRLWRVYSMVVRNRVIQVAQPYDVRHDLATTAALHSLRPLVAFAPIMAWLIWFIIGRALAPLKRLEKEVRSRDSRSLSPVMEDGLPSEIAPVAQALNSLLARLQRAFAGQRAFVADAAHELRSPMTALKLQLHLLASAQSEAEKEAALRNLNAGVGRASQLIEQLLMAARTEIGAAATKQEPVDLAETMRHVIAEVFPLAEHRAIEMSMDAAEHVRITGDRAQLHILLRNLLDNAIRYTPAGGVVQARIEQTKDHVCVYVDDSGPGIPPEERKQVFRRFYRGHSVSASGNGLGLAIVKNIVARHNGKIQLGQSPLGGLQVYVCFVLQPSS